MSRLRWAPPVAWAVLILVLTSAPPAEFAPMSAVAFPGADKVVHTVLYLILGWLSGRAAGPDVPRRARLAILLGVIAFAALDELHQLFIPGRSADPLDWMADSLGASAGMLLAALALRRPRYS